MTGRASKRCNGGSSYRLIWDTVSRIPRGRVSTYGAVARMAGLPGRARMVGYAMHSVPSGSDIPWHRVVNSQGTISRHPDPSFACIQRSLLEREGVVFDEGGRIDLARFAWRGREGDLPEGDAT